MTRIWEFLKGRNTSRLAVFSLMLATAFASNGDWVPALVCVFFGALFDAAVGDSKP